MMDGKTGLNVVPAQAGTHNHPRQLLEMLFVAFFFQQGPPRRMGPGPRAQLRN